MKNPYSPAGRVAPLTVTSVEKEMVVLSSAPALQGDFTSEPKPKTSNP